MTSPADPSDADATSDRPLDHTEPMSHTEPSDHDCDDAVAQLYSFLDGELDAATVGKVEAHLKRCSPCLEAFDFEAELRKVVAVKCRDQVPDELRTRILSVLDQLEDAPDGGPAPEA